MSRWEFKFVFKDDRIAEPFFDLISGLHVLAGYSCRQGTALNYIDYYFDSPDLKLESQGIVFRARTIQGAQHAELILKRQGIGPNREVVYLQSEPMLLENDALQKLLSGELPEGIRSILGVFTGSQRLDHIVTLRVFRRVIGLGVDSGSVVLFGIVRSEPPGSKVSVDRQSPRTVATLNLDRVEALLPGSGELKARDYEIELKSDLELFPQIDPLKEYLQNAFGLIPVTRSKLRRLSRVVRPQRKDERKKVILDMDTGVDDALAIILAMESPELEVLGFTIVGGNVNAAQSARNTEAVLSHLDPYVRSRYPSMPLIAVGDSLKAGMVDASDVHGPDGLGGVCEKYRSHSLNNVVDCDAVTLFKRVVGAHQPGTITLITTGPLTNVARWIQECPDMVKRLKEIICMGGVFFQAGNRSQAAEFNIHCAPGPARKVVEFCRSPISPGIHEWRETMPVTFIGLDITHQVRFRRQVLEEALEKRPKDERLLFVMDISSYYMDFYYRNEGLNGCYLHDPLAVAYAIEPTLCLAEQYHVEIEDQGKFTSGMTVADYRPTRLFKDKMKEVTWVCYKVDAERFESLFYQRVLGLGR